MSRRMAILVAAAAAAGLAGRACGDGETSGAAGSGGVMDAALDPVDVKPPDATFDVTSDVKPDTPVSCPAVQPPDDVPAGWVQYPVLGCKYRLWVPPTKDLLPKGLTWEDCTDLGPSTYACKQLVIDWPNPEPYAIGGVVPGYVEPDGRVVMQIRKIYASAPIAGENASATLAEIVEADGPVRQAFWQSAIKNPQWPDWYTSQAGISPGKSAWKVSDNTTDPTRTAAFGGNDSDLHPPLLFDLPDDDPLEGTPHAGPEHFAIQKAVLAVRSWTGTDFGVIWKGGQDIDPPVWAGTTLFWGASSIARSELWVWSAAGGVHTVVSFGNDLTKGAASGSTNGKDIVWLQGEERALDGSSDGTFPKRSVMTAPFTTDPTAVQAKRLRSWPAKSIWGALRPAVGCGYVAYQHVPQELVNQVLIVRLSDGVSWMLDSPADHHWWWSTPIAITCKELFISYGKIGVDRIRRIQLDSLGPGIPPD